MADYISREAALADFERCNRKNPTWTPQRVKTLLMRIPAADVEPVRHVHRKVWGIDEYYGEWLRCPNCGYEDNAANATYCGGCGAKIDLEGE
nr:MAG TPA: ribosome, girodazole, girolline, antibiotic complex, 50S [Caudoviricetes sp.]